MTALARLSLANRSLVIMIAVVVSAFGAFAIPSLKQQLLPSLSFPGAFVVTAYQGASPEIVEEQVTKPIEDSFQGIAGVTEVTSTSREGLSQVQVAFEYGTDIDDAVAKMQQSVARIEAGLPEGTDPQVMTGGTDDIPVLVLAVEDGGDGRAMADKLERIMVPELRGIEGVRDVVVTGVRDETVVITPDLKKLALLGLQPTAIADVLRASGQPIPAGGLTEDGKSLTVQVGSRIDSLKELEDLYLTPAAPVAQAPQGQRQAAQQGRQVPGAAGRPVRPGPRPRPSRSGLPTSPTSSGSRRRPRR
ncbi:efflux RND transporter permease subunit [Planomonospora algeriensis]